MSGKHHKPPPHLIPIVAGTSEQRDLRSTVIGGR